MVKIASWIKQVITEIKGFDLPEVQEERREFIKDFKQKMAKNKNLLRIKEEVKEFAKTFPVPGID